VKDAFCKKNFWCQGRFRWRRWRSAAITRLWPRGLKSRRPLGSLISGLFGLEGISKRKGSHCRWAMRGLAPVKDLGERKGAAELTNC
jgi:hypothetical protein